MFFIFLNIIQNYLPIKDKNYPKSIVPLPSASIYLMRSWISYSVGFYPNDLMTSPNYYIIAMVYFCGHWVVTILIVFLKLSLKGLDLVFSEIIRHSTNLTVSTKLSFLLFSFKVLIYSKSKLWTIFQFNLFDFSIDTSIWVSKVTQSKRPNIDQL